MYQFIETIAVVNGQIRNFNYHNNRFRDTYRIHFSINKSNLLSETINKLGPNLPKEGLYKLRIIYSKSIDNISIEPYIITEIKRLKLIEDDNIIYTYKSSNRDNLNTLFSQREKCENILIIQKGFITDTAFGNIIFLDGEKWITPDTPLLKGTMRQSLLDNRVISKSSIHKSLLSNFKSFKHINAMISFEDSPIIDISAII